MSLLPALTLTAPAVPPLLAVPELRLTGPLPADPDPPLPTLTVPLLPPLMVTDPMNTAPLAAPAVLLPPPSTDTAPPVPVVPTPP